MRAVPVNTRLRENPILQRMPKNQREWSQYTNELAKWVIKIAKLGDGSLTTSDDTTISGLDQIPGRVPSERSLPMATVGNKSSVQDSSALTSTDAGASATITIGAHILKTPSGDVSFNAGSVTGLSYNTTYYVYADDPTYAGGAVTYLASTDPTDVVGDEGRYYVGSITSALEGTAGNISGITKGSPTTFTLSAAHGWSTGNTVLIDNIVDNGPGGDIESTFNGNSYSITVTTTTEFTVAVDSSSLTNTWESGGTATRTNTGTSGGFGGGGGSGGGQIP